MDEKLLRELAERAAAYAAQLPPAPPALTAPTGAALAGWIDHTLLRPEATAAQIKQLCAEAREHRFASVCVNPVFVKLAAALLKDSGVPVCTVVGFPLGASLPDFKAYETRLLTEAGAREIDMVINIGALKGDAWPMVLNEIQLVTAEAHAAGALVKVIIEAALLTREEKILACILAQAAGADFVKTSTGFGPGGATVEDVELMRRVVGPEMGVKAAGGIRTLRDALAMIAAGANRLGSSAGVAIVQEAKTCAA